MATQTPAGPGPPIVAIGEFDLPSVLPSGEAEFVSFSISNEGDTLARRCSLKGRYLSGSGDEFSVRPHDAEKHVTWVVNAPGRGEITVDAYVLCANARSERESRQTTVM